MEGKVEAEVEVEIGECAVAASSDIADGTFEHHAPAALASPSRTPPPPTDRDADMVQRRRTKFGTCASEAQERPEARKENEMKKKGGAKSFPLFLFL